MGSIWIWSAKHIWSAVVADSSGAADARAAIQSAIDICSAAGGGLLKIQAGTYQVSAPLVEPRSLPDGRGAVHLDGFGVGQTIIKGGPSFPAGRAVIEWAPRTGATLFEGGARWRAWNQRISNMTIIPAAVDGCRAIHYACEDPENPTLERWHGAIENVSIEASNAYCPECIYIEGSVINSRFAQIWNDCARGNPVESSQYATMALRFDEGDGSSPDRFHDHLGAHWSTIEGVVSTVIRGGWSTVIRGRFNGCELRGLIGGVGSHNGSVQFDLRNSVNTRCSGLFSEGRLDAAQYRLTRCEDVTLDGIGIGTPNRNNVPAPWSAGTLGNGVELVDSTRCRVSGGWSSTSTPSFSHLNYPTEPKESAARVVIGDASRLCEVDVDIGNVDEHDQVVVELGTAQGRKNRTRSLRRYDGTVVERHDGVS